MTLVASAPKGDDSYDPDAIMKKMQEMYESLPSGWKKNPNPNGTAPFVHDDGRVSWKHPSRDEMNRLVTEMTGYNNKRSMIPESQLALVRRYRRMLSSGVPAAAVEQRARLEGVDPILMYSENDAALTAAAADDDDDDDNEVKGKVLSEKPPHVATRNSFQNSSLKRFKKMLKAGIPVKAVQQAARVQGVDISDLMNATSDAMDKENYPTSTLSCNNKAPFEAFPDKNLVVFKKGTELMSLVTKLAQTISKRAKASTDTGMTVDLRVLYHSLGALRGVQHSRDVYNSTTNDKNMPILEVRSKRKPFLELASSLGMETPKDWKTVVDIHGLDDLVLFIESAYRHDLQAVDSLLGVGVYDFGSLSQIYKPGTRVVATNAFAAGVGMICEVAWNRYEEGKTLFGVSRSFKVCFHFVVAVGNHFTIAECVEGMDNFEGKRQVNQLSFVPLAGYSAEEAYAKVARFEDRGRLYNEIATKQTYMEYDKGSFYGKLTGGADGANALHSGGRLMVDTQGGYEHFFSIGTGQDNMVMEIKSMYKQYALQMRAQKNSADSSKTGPVQDGKMILFDSVPDDYLAMTWPAVVGFSFQSKVWGDVLVDGLKHIEYQDNIFDKIVLPPARKRMVKALVKHSCDSFNDVVRGKGEGSVFLLYGEPGVGKTLTAEGICEMLHKPLYTVSLGQLGSTAAALEKNLDAILILCARWDALILLDEADIFLEKRSSTGSLERNAMVSVMLRLVEYFKGVLFLTSNRIDSLDPAFKTRITLALRYDALDVSARNQIWINLLKSSGFGTALEKGVINTEELAKSVLNGREIKNSIRLGMALAAEDGEPLSQKALLETIDILNEYNQQAASSDASYDKLRERSAPRLSNSSSTKQQQLQNRRGIRDSCTYGSVCLLLLALYLLNQWTPVESFLVTKTIPRRSTLLVVPPQMTRSPASQIILGQSTLNDDSTETSAESTSPATATGNTEYSFFDEAIIFVRAGAGGQGASTYKKGVGGQNGPPDGGNGGRGGNVILEVDASLNTLAGLNPQAFRPNAFGGSGAAKVGSSSNSNSANSNAPVYSSSFVRSFKAERGQEGERQNKSGRYGQHVRVRLPPGTLVQEQITESDGSITYKTLGTLSLPDNPTMIVAEGGEGGEGSGAGSKGRSGVRRARLSHDGGEKKTIKLTLKIVADVALVGTPNAGKSTFLAAVTRAKPKIANYPFTTVIPNLGVWIPPESDYRGQGSAADNNNQQRQLDGAGSEGLALCDVPGLIKGAADGIGLGHAFLRHIERCHVILHLVDPTAEDPIDNFHMINQEITKYGTGQLATMPQVVVINKCDVWDEDLATALEADGIKPTITEKELEAKLREVMPHTRLMRMSAKEKDGVDDLMIRLESFVKKVKEASAAAASDNSDE